MPNANLPLVLPRPLFLDTLRRSTALAERTKLPLSILLIRLDPDAPGHPRKAAAFIRSIAEQLRVGDGLGYLATDEIGVLLPFTGEAGAKVVRRRILELGADLSLSVTTGLYPAQIFERLKEPDARTSHAPALLMESAASASDTAGRFIKRALDLVGATGALLLLSPLMLATAVAIQFTSPGPVIFRQIRLGQDFTPFVFYKFRSMYAQTDDRAHREYVANLIDGNLGAIDQGVGQARFYKMTQDARVTPIGRFIRKTSIDELPQLFNVLRGEMSLVGPRPPLPYETEKYQAWHLQRMLGIKPGITGLWQVEGRSRTSFDEMVRLDLRYAREWSLLLDLKILLKTVKVVLQCRGAA
jgi:lipopolysaccharide/colanic/teichoic acid biosynthesis glycosyltransferase